MYAMFLLENLKGKDNLKDLGVNGRIMLEWIIKNYVQTRFIWFMKGNSNRLLCTQ